MASATRCRSISLTIVMTPSVARPSLPAPRRTAAAERAAAAGKTTAPRSAPAARAAAPGAGDDDRCAVAPIARRVAPIALVEAGGMRGSARVHLNHQERQHNKQ